MKSVGIGDKRREAIYGIVAAVLHLGNVQFSPKEIDDAEGSEMKVRECESQRVR